MTIWEKAVLNMQKGARKINATAVLLAERVRTELAIVRLRIRVDEVQAHIDELHKIIGRRVETLKNNEALPRTSEQLVKDEDIAVSLNELIERGKELEDLKSDIKKEQDAFKSAPKHTEDKTV